MTRSERGGRRCYVLDIGVATCEVIRARETNLLMHACMNAAAARMHVYIDS